MADKQRFGIQGAFYFLYTFKPCTHIRRRIHGLTNKSSSKDQETSVPLPYVHLIY